MIICEVIDSSDPEGKGHGLHWDNPLAKKVLETAESQIAADLVRDYLEHYKLDYTLAIFIPEANLKDQPLDRNEVGKKAGILAPSEEPLLVQLLKQKQDLGASIGKKGGRLEPLSVPPKGSQLPAAPAQKNALDAVEKFSPQEKPAKKTQPREEIKK